MDSEQRSKIQICDGVNYLYEFFPEADVARGSFSIAAVFQSFLWSLIEGNRKTAGGSLAVG